MNYCLNFHFINHIFFFFCNPTLSVLTSLLGKWKPSHQLHWFTNCPNIYRDLTGKSKRTYRSLPENIPRTFLQVGKGDLYSRGCRSHIPGDGQLANGKIFLSFSTRISFQEHFRATILLTICCSTRAQRPSSPLSLHVFLSFGSSTTKWNYNRFQPRQVLQHIYIVAVKGGKKDLLMLKIVVF